MAERAGLQLKAKIRLGSRVRHKTRAELGEGEVWELRHNGLVSVHWDSDKKAWKLRDFHLPDTRAINKRHYQRANLEIIQNAKV